MAGERDAYPLTKRLSESEWEAIEDLLARLDAALAPIAALPRKAKLSARVEALARALEAAAESDEKGDLEGAEELLALFDRLRSDAGERLEFDARGFAAFLDALLFETTVRGPRRAHPRLKILGPLEARLMQADLVLLSGLDEGVWPPQAETGAFLNRAMREALGLTPPERRIGQSAHDFEMALGAPASRAEPRHEARRIADGRLTLSDAARGARRRRLHALQRARRADARHRQGARPARDDRALQDGRSRDRRWSCVRRGSASRASKGCGATLMRFTRSAS